MATPTAQMLKKLPKRIQKEIQRIAKNAPPGISIAPDSDNYRYFHVIIAGPDDTPYAGGIFKLEMFLTKEYPIKPPKCRFLTKIYHPNVDKLGRICLDIIKDKWSPALTVIGVCSTIQLLMQDPNPDDPLDTQVAALWKSDLPQAHKIAREWTQKFAQ
eukprot:CAMPEP_0202713760 /NCGR_PEP_ID=MMETSP1385-20130828/59175_1 /ASSEMBLY_ACC=CAM_ASM_000861 /TAXON_ID=933848 /ORGANISM="Elphidium margaritaceum" /LENGTH=157 /DNA_ID=CAMNT_0049374229 /DNA_START=129 /DNA_END=602 /DNA_ORIENTATION=-